MHPEISTIQDWLVLELQKQINQEKYEKKVDSGDEDNDDDENKSYGCATTMLLMSASNIETTDWLTRLADEMILSYPHALVPERWRLLYIDAAICAALLVCKEKRCNTESRSRKDAIHKLDRALIVAGPQGERFDYIHVLIKIIQNEESECNDSERPRQQQEDMNWETNKKRRRRSTPDATITTKFSERDVSKEKELPIYCPIPRYSPEDAPSLDQSDTPLLSPFIITNALSHWPALNEDHPWKDMHYINSVAGPYRIVPVESGSSYTLPDWTQKLIPFEEFLSSLKSSSYRNGNYHPSSLSSTGVSPAAGKEEHNDNGDTDEKPLYLAQHDLFRQFPSLLNDTITPDLVFSAPPTPPYFPSYVPPQNDLGYTMNAWFGPRGTFSPAHTDPYYNCYAQVVGRKWIWIAPPDLQSEMYPYGKLSPSDKNADNMNATIVTTEEEEEDSTTLEMMQNTSRIDVTVQPDIYQKKFPLYSSLAAPRAMQAILEPGDLLFMPPKWWHSMKSLDISFSVSYWF